MSGAVFAVIAGVSFGLFQAVNRRANTTIDAYRGTFGLVFVCTIALAIVSVLSQDLSLVADAPLSAHLSFMAAGVVHFYFGWTFLSLSQVRDGAGRTGAAAAAAPLVGTVLAVLVLGEEFTALTGLGVVLVVAGVAVLSLRSPAGRSSAGSVPWFGLLAASSWGTSPIFIRWGLEGLPAPLLGVTIGMAGTTLAYAITLTVTRRWGGAPVSHAARMWLTVAGLIVAVAIVAQWTAYDNIEIAVALTIMQLSAPTVILVAPVIVGGEMEKVTVPLVAGTALVMAASILVLLS